MSDTAATVPGTAGTARKPTIVHVIDSFLLGGTEAFFLNLLPDLLDRYEIVLVTLKDDLQFDEARLLGLKRHILGFTGAASIPRCAMRLRRIIRRHRPDLVRAQLLMSGIVARVATPRSIPLVFSLHSRMSEDAYTKNRLAAPLERITYRKRHHVVAVTRDALDDFDRWIGIKGPADVLPNFINPDYLAAARVREALGHDIRLVAVGNLKPVKNYSYLVEAFRRIGDLAGVSLDIYGEGTLRVQLQEEIDRHRVPIRLMGRRPDIPAILPQYDLFVMPSWYEGFANGAVEAMAAGLPVLASDLPMLREVLHGNAVFFDPADPDSFVRAITALRNGELPLRALSEKGIAIVRQHYSAEEYLGRLDRIYRQAMLKR